MCIARDRLVQGDETTLYVRVVRISNMFLQVATATTFSEMDRTSERAMRNFFAKSGGESARVAGIQYIIGLRDLTGQIVG
jgi:hypothetical protein